ncbi:MAG: YqiA/YcfP family alpha/beta fold hydrolase [Pseudomonadota bacterium]
MQSVICVYLHGFLSSASSQKGRWLVQQVQTENSQVQQASEAVFKEIITMTYPIASPAQSVQKIETLLQDLLTQKEHPIVLMGSSMGGYYAQFLGQKYKLPYIMINPALNPKPIFLENLGASYNPSTGEKFVIDNAYIQQLESYDVTRLDRRIPVMLLMDEGDDVIDVATALMKYQDKRALKTEIHVFKGGDHAFQHMSEAWPLIKSFVGRLEKGD